MSAPKITADDKRRIVVMTRQGFPAHEIADVLGVTVRTVSRHRHALGVAQPRHPAHGDDVRRRAAELLADGASFSETARTLGVSAWAVASWFPGRGWTREEAGTFARWCRASQASNQLRRTA